MTRPTPLHKRMTANTSAAGHDECWLWLGRPDRDGYGRVWDNDKRKTRGAHCVAWELFHGQEIPSGLCVCHACDTPSCVNPRHLWLGTNQDNTRDKVAKRRQATGDRISGPRKRSYAGTQNPKAKLNEEKVRSIRARYGKEPREVLAAEFGVSGQMVYGIAMRRFWRHVA